MFKIFKKIIVIVSITLLLCTFTFAGFFSKSKSKSVNLTGSTTVLPIAQACAEYYMTNVDKKAKITVSGGGSGVGIAAIIDSKTDIGDSSREVKKEEFEQGKAKGVDINPIPIALDGIVVVVNDDVSVTDLSMEKLKGIFNGTIKNWNEVGGNDAEIIIVSRDTSSGTYGTFTEMVLGKDKLRADAMMTASNQAVATTVSQTKNSIGYIGIGYLKSAKLKSVKVNGIEATNATVKSKKYPLSRELFMITNGKPKGDVKKFIDFVLSSKGQDIVEESDFVKLK